jgi:ferredoxin-fold anticodon binding domain-containing protein
VDNARIAVIDRDRNMPKFYGEYLARENRGHEVVFSADSAEGLVDKLAKIKRRKKRIDAAIIDLYSNPQLQNEHQTERAIEAVLAVFEYAYIVTVHAIEEPPKGVKTVLDKKDIRGFIELINNIPRMN